MQTNSKDIKDPHLKAEIERGADAARLLAEHLNRMYVDEATVIATVGDRIYQIEVTRLKELPDKVNKMVAIDIEDGEGSD